MDSYTMISSSFRLCIFLGVISSTCVSSSPMPMSNLLSSRQDITCSVWDSVEGTNSKEVWGVTGTSSFLGEFLEKNGNDNWANNMDRLTTGDGTGASSLRCDTLPGDCALPTLQCDFFTPKAYFYVRRALAESHLALDTVRQQMVANTIVNGLGIGAMVQQFGATTVKTQTALCTEKILKDTQGAIGVAGGLVSAVKDSLPGPGKLAGGIIAGMATAISNTFGIVANNVPKCAADSVDLSAIDAHISSALSDIFTSSNTKLAEITAAIYSGQGDLSIIPSQTSENGEVNPIARFFAGGKWLVPDKGDISALVGELFGAWNIAIKQTLIGSLLQSLNLFIYQQTDMSTEELCSQFNGGARFIDNACYLLVLDGNSAGSAANDAINNLDNPSKGDFKIDIADIYRSSIACQAAHPNGDGSVDTTIANTDGNIPACFYQLPILTGNTKNGPCRSCTANISNRLIVESCVSLCGCTHEIRSDGAEIFNCPL